MGLLTTLQQLSFTGGEWSPTLSGRFDLAKYTTAAKTVKNFIVEYYGGVTNRPGLRYVGETKDSTKKSRLIPFRFSVLQEYALEIGHEYMRVIADGAYVVYPVGDPNAGDPIEFVTPYDQDDLDRIQYAQKGDILILVHPGYAVTTIKRFSDTSWTVETVPFGTSTEAPTGLASDSVGTAFYYKVTAVAGGEESQGSEVAGSSTETSTLSWGTVFGAEYYNVYKLKNGSYNWIGDAEGASFKDSTLDGDTTKRPPASNNPFSADPVVESIGSNLVPSQTYIDGLTSSGGGWTVSTTNWWGSTASYGVDKAFDGIDNVANVAYLTDATGVATVTITPDAPVAVGGYSIASGNWGPNMVKSWTFEGYDGADWITLDSQTGQVAWANYEKRIFTFVNEVEYEAYRLNILSGNSASYSTIAEMEMYTVTYSTASNYPGSATLYQQRSVFARTNAKPQTFFGSKTGTLFNFDVSQPLQPDDSYEFALDSNQFNEVQWIVALRSLLIGTSGGEYEVTSDGGSITPTDVNASFQGNIGSEPIQPIVTGPTVVFVARGGQNIFSYGYQNDIGGYDGNDLTEFATHLFRTRGVRCWAFQKLPYSVLWVVCDDGTLLGLTLNLRQQVIAWHQHETDGTFESVVTLQGSNDTYFIVNRTIDGSTVRYVEQLSERFLDGDISNTSGFFVDCGLTYEGAAATVISGLGHLEGEEVVVLADGFVVRGHTVSSGQITLAEEASVVHVGLPYQSTLETLELEAQVDGGTIQDKSRRVVSALFRLEDSRALKAGPDEDNLTEMPLRSDEVWGDAPALVNGNVPMDFYAAADGESAHVYVQNDDPVPLAIRAIYPRIEIGGQ